MSGSAQSRPYCDWPSLSLTQSINSLTIRLMKNDINHVSWLSDDIFFSRGRRQGFRKARNVFSF